MGVQKSTSLKSPFSRKDFWQMVYVNYVAPELLRFTPTGWEERVMIVELAPGLLGHCLDAHDVAYNKLWAGRPKDIAWVYRLLGTGVITLECLEELHGGNDVPKIESEKVMRSLDAVKALLGG
jgi:hypothetical protein